MSNETQKIYEKLINEATNNIVMSISRADFDITDKVFDDHLLSVRDEINKCIERKQNKD